LILSTCEFKLGTSTDVEELAEGDHQEPGDKLRNAEANECSSMVWISDYLILFLPTYSLAIHHLWH